MADILNVRMSPHLKRHLHDRAASEGVSMSALARRWLLERAEGEERKRHTNNPAITRKHYCQDKSMEHTQ